MNLTISNYRGISHGAISLHPKLTLIAGTNHAGKSSVCQALSCLLTGNTLPIIGVLKKHSYHLVHEGAPSGHATLDGYTITWPDCKLSGVSTFVSSEYGAGRCPPVDMEPQEWAMYLNAKPTRADLASALGATTDLDDIWQRLQRDSWDQVRDHYVDIGKKLKGQWRQLTGQDYGSAQSPKWRPTNLDVTGKTEQDLIDGLAEAEQLYENAIAQQALSKLEITQLNKLNNDRERAIGILVKLQTAMNDAEHTWREAQKETANYKTPTNGAITYECPQCTAVLALSNDALHIHDGKRPSRKQVRDALAKHDDHVAKVNQLYKDYEDSLQAYRDAMAYADQCTRAHKQLKELPPTTVTLPQTEVEPAKKLVQVMRDALAAHRSYQQAKSILVQIQNNQTVQDVLAPGGLRKQVLSKSLSEINETLKSACKTAKWGVVQIDENLHIHYDSKPYALLSLSEQYRVNVTLQVVLARIDNSAVLVIDAADILDASGRNGLIELLISSGKPAMVAMTFTQKSQAPDLQYAGIGVTYWVENSTVKELSGVNA